MKQIMYQGTQQSMEESRVFYFQNHLGTANLQVGGTLLTLCVWINPYLKGKSVLIIVFKFGIQESIDL